MENAPLLERRPERTPAPHVAVVYEHPQRFF